MMPSLDNYFVEHMIPSLDNYFVEHTAVVASG